MKCKQAKQSMALSVGRDLDESSNRELQRHVTSCPPCRDYFGRLRESTSVLQQASEASCEPTSEECSVWPAVSRSLRKPSRGSSPFAWSQAWVPAVALASMVLAIISISNTMSSPLPDGTIFVGPGGVGGASTISERGGSQILQPTPVSSKEDPERLRDARD